MRGRSALESASASRRTLSGSGCNGPGAGGSASRATLPAKGASCTSVGRLSTTVWRSRNARDDGAQRILARRAGRMDAFRDGPDRAHHLGLVDIKIRLDGAGGHVPGQHQQRRPALRRLADAGQRIGEPRPRMHADQGELLGGFGIGVRHARRVAFVARRDELDAGFHEGVRNLEVGRAEQAEAAARAVVGEVLGEHRRNRRIILHEFIP